MRKRFFGVLCLLFLVYHGGNSLFAQTEYRLYGTSTYSGGSIFSLNSTGTDLLTHKIFSANGNGPVGSLVESDGRLYGMTSGGGSFNAGIIFSKKSDGTDFQLIHEFNSTDGSQPEDGLILAADGMLYGLTSRGGSFNNGIAFRINKNGTGFEKVHDFLSAQGKTPVGRLMQASDGDFYGMTSEGGDFQKGTVFKIDHTTFDYTLLYEFDGLSNGGEPHGTVVEGIDGRLYGMTFGGGASSKGVIFGIDANGSNFNVVHDFSGTDGADPFGDLVTDSAGDLFGMTSKGGTDDLGVIFRISPDGSNYELLKDLDGTAGVSPDGSFILKDDFLYGVTKGAASPDGTVFKLSTDGLTFEVLYAVNDESRFDLTGTLVMDADGDLYGLKAPSGDLHEDVGSIYKLNIQDLQLSTVHSFVLTQGSVPVSRMVQGPDLRLYGTTVAGGANGVGAIYSITTTGDDFQVVHSFQESEGKFVYGGLIPIDNGYFAGTTAFGGAFLNGVVYKIKYDGTGFTKLHDFQASEGSGSFGRLALGNDGKLYGLANGGTNGHGTIFRVGQDGSNFEIIHEWTGTDGSTPRGGLIKASNGSFYGVTSAGGTGGDPAGLGVIFKIEQSTTYTKLLDFDGLNGQVPYGDMIEASDGKLYGMTSDSENGAGVVYKINTDGSGYAIVHEFTANEGGHPLGALTQAPTGEFYAMATADGRFGTGYIFRLDQDGSGFLKLADLNFINGNPESSLSVVPLATQTISFDQIPVKTLGDADFNLHATATSTLPVTFTSSDTDVATVVDDVVTIVGAGTATITARQNGNVFYSTATATRELVVNKKDQTITFGTLQAKAFGDGTFQLTATTTSSLPISFASDNEDVATISDNTVTIVGVGTANITASQGGNSEYNAATPVVQPLNVGNASQTITFGVLDGKTFGAAPFQLTATSSSLLTVSFASDNENVATISGNTVTITGAGTANITASQPGNSTYNAATPVVQQLTVDKGSQSITFGAISTKTLGDAPFAITATATSGLAVSFTTTSDKITISSGSVTIVKAGKASIKAEQNGNSNYTAASFIEQSFCINPAKPVITRTNNSATSVTLTSSNLTGNQWYSNGQTISGATSRDFSPTQNGRYTVQTTVDDCVSQVSEFVDVAFTGLNEPLTNTISVYPNPVHDEVYIEVSGGNGGKAYVTLMDVTGRVVENRTVDVNSAARFDTGNLSRGMFFFRVHTERRTSTHSFVRE